MVNKGYIKKKAAYEHLIFYQNICRVRKEIADITKLFPRGSLKLVAQMRDASRSAKQNIREGYRKDSAGEFAHAIKISLGSLGELEGDLDDCYEDGLLNKTVYDRLKELMGKTNYLADRYIDSLYKMNRQGRWKSRFKK